MSYRYLQPPFGERQPHSVRRACHAGRPTVSCGTGWTGRRAKPLAIASYDLLYDACTEYPIYCELSVQ